MSIFSRKMADSSNVNLTTWRGIMRTAEYFSKMPRRNADILARKINAPMSKVAWAVCAKCTVEV